MMGIGFPELMIILVIIMIIFGAGKLPEIGSAFGNSIKNFKKSMKDAENENLPASEDSAEGDAENVKEVAEQAESDQEESAVETQTPVSETTESK